jgi:hypothetical protein
MLERLRQLLPPPADPVEPGRPDGWAEVETAIGTQLPGDFKAFTELYGSGMVDDFLYLFNPFAAGQDGNLLVELYWVTERDPDDWPVALLESRAAFLEVHPMPVTGLLAALAANQLTSRVLPDDVLGRSSHQFTPLG